MRIMLCGCIWVVMALRIDLVDLASEVAEIARATTDAGTAVRLMELVNRLLTEAGLPEEDAEGGGDLPPTPWNNATPIDYPECA
jgi:hypothetical protein